jgi:hypothetical protein
MSGFQSLNLKTIRQDMASKKSCPATILDEQQNAGFITKNEI